MSSLHRDIGAGEQHSLHQWEYVDTTARDAATYTAADIGKVARVGAAEPYEFFILNSVAPTWESHGGISNPLSANLDFNSFNANSIRLADMVYLDRGDVTGAVAINWGNSLAQRIRLTGNTTLTFSGTDPTLVTRVMLLVVQDGTGGHTLTLPVSKKPGGTITITGTANAQDILTLVEYGPNGWYVIAGNDML